MIECKHRTLYFFRTKTNTLPLQYYDIFTWFPPPLMFLWKRKDSFKNQLDNFNAVATYKGLSQDLPLYDISIENKYNEGRARAFKIFQKLKTKRNRSSLVYYMPDFMQLRESGTLNLIVCCDIFFFFFLCDAK